MMTELEIVAKATAMVLRTNTGKWAKSEADAAVAYATEWFKNGQCTVEDFTKAVGRLGGNHSARRQFLEKSGLIVSEESNSAEKTHILDAMKALDNAAMDLATTPAAKVEVKKP